MAQYLVTKTAVTADDFEGLASRFRGQMMSDARAEDAAQATLAWMQYGGSERLGMRLRGITGSSLQDEVTTQTALSWLLSEGFLRPA